MPRRARLDAHGTLRSAVPIALRSKLIETLGGLPGLFEKLRFFSTRNTAVIPNLNSYPMPSWQRSGGRRKIWDQLVPQYLPTPPGSDACSQWG